MSRVLLYVAAIVIVGAGIIEIVRLLLGEGWSWFIAIGYGVVLVVLLIAARVSRNAPSQYHREQSR